jgi:peptide deformylase
MLEVLTLDDPMLHRRADPVAEVGEGQRRLADEMIATMHEKEGIGLAAPQVGRPVRMFVTKAPEDRERVFINPEIVGTSIETEAAEEGCLSIPGVRADVERAAAVRVQAFNRRGRRFTVAAEGMLARVIQHELDHLNGVLFIDRLSAAERERVLREYAELSAEAAAGDPAQEPEQEPEQD